MSKRDPKMFKDETSEVQDMIEDSNRLHSLKVVLDQEGGRMLVEALMEDVMGALNHVTSGYKTLNHAELMAQCATLKANLDLVSTLKRASLNEKELDEWIKEQLPG